MTDIKPTDWKTCKALAVYEACMHELSATLDKLHVNMMLCEGADLHRLNHIRKNVEELAPRAPRLISVSRSIYIKHLHDLDTSGTLWARFLSELNRWISIVSFFDLNV